MALTPLRALKGGSQNNQPGVIKESPGKYSIKQVFQTLPYYQIASKTFVGSRVYPPLDISVQGETSGNWPPQSGSFSTADYTMFGQSGDPTNGHHLWTPLDVLLFMDLDRMVREYGWYSAQHWSCGVGVMERGLASGIWGTQEPGTKCSVYEHDLIGFVSPSLPWFSLKVWATVTKGTYFRVVVQYTCTML